LYPPERCAADDEHRRLADVPEEVMSASRPRLAGSLIERVRSRGIRAAFAAGGERGTAAVNCAPGIGQRGGYGCTLGVK
jgi:hypothetical protein